MEKVVPTKLDRRLVEELDKLVGQGLYASRSEAIRSAVRELVTKSYLSLQEFHEKIAKIASELIVQQFGERVSDVILYGSVAKGAASVESDIDLLVLTTEEEGTEGFREMDREIVRTTYSIDLAAGVVTTPLLMSRKRLMALVEEGYTFAMEILESGLQLHGDFLRDVRSRSPLKRG